MSINSTYFLNAADLASATAVYLDSSLDNIAPDNFYSNEIISRQQLGGVLLAAETCDCGPCLNCVPGLPIPIGTQKWTNCNLDVTTYRDGTPIPEVTDPTAWVGLTTGAWCYYNNDPLNGATYGKLYNWYAVNDTIHGGLAPIGYHVPTDAEWTVLTDYLGGESVAGGKMKEAGLCHWGDPNTDATNSSGFTGLPGGSRTNGTFNLIGYYGFWWSSSEYDTATAWYRDLDYYEGYSARLTYNKTSGFSVRLIEDCSDCILICDQTWTNKNLDVATYNDGTPIPQVTNPTQWANLTTGAWCYYDNDLANGAIYGKLYNWYAVNDTIHGGLAPTGYHVPTDAEWTTLTTCLGGETIAGGKMKSTGTTLWASPNTDATNSSGFTALPGGSRSMFGASENIGFYDGFWSSTESDSFNAWERYLSHGNDNAGRGLTSKTLGFSVRLIKDNIT